EALLSELDATLNTLATRPTGERFDSFRDYYEADREIHRAIVAGTNNRFRLHAYDALGGHVQRFRLYSGRGVTDAEETVAEHTDIRRAIAEGDSPAADAAMRAHLIGVRTRSLAELVAG